MLFLRAARSGGRPTSSLMDCTLAFQRKMCSEMIGQITGNGMVALSACREMPFAHWRAARANIVRLSHEHQR